MTRNLTRISIGLVTLALLVACGNNDMLSVKKLFGPTMTKAFAQDANDEPLSSEVIAGLAKDRPLSLTTDPIDL